MRKAIKYLIICLALLQFTDADAQRPALQKLSPLVREACLSVQQLPHFNRAKALNLSNRVVTALLQRQSGYCKHSFEPVVGIIAFSFHRAHRSRQA